MSLTFQASTQFGDWHGTAAADEYGGGANDFDEVFTATGQVDLENEIMIGFEFFAGEGYFFLAGYFHSKPAMNTLGWIPALNEEFQNAPGLIHVKRVKAEITMEQFFKYFKRFSVILLSRGLDISGRE